MISSDLRTIRIGESMHRTTSTNSFRFKLQSENFFVGFRVYCLTSHENSRQQVSFRQCPSYRRTTRITIIFGTVAGRFNMLSRSQSSEQIWPDMVGFFFEGRREKILFTQRNPNNAFQLFYLNPKSNNHWFPYRQSGILVILYIKNYFTHNKHDFLITRINLL